MELETIVASLVISHSGDSAIIRDADYVKTRRSLGNNIAMIHPDGFFLLQILKERQAIPIFDREFCNPILTPLTF